MFMCFVFILTQFKAAKRHCFKPTRHGSHIIPVLSASLGLLPKRAEAINSCHSTFDLYVCPPVHYWKAAVCGIGTVLNLTAPLVLFALAETCGFCKRPVAFVMTGHF